MEQNYSSTKLPTVGASSAIGGASAWSNPSRITADDGSSASWGAFMGGQMSAITGSSFGFQQLPANAVIDGIQVYVDGSQTGCYGNVTLNISGTTGKAIGALNTTYGDSTDLWGLDEIDPADIASISVTIDANDVSGGDGIASIDYVSITVFWHIEMAQVPSDDVPTRFDYKVYSRDGAYLGLLPKVTSKFGFAQDINSAGSSIVVTCGKFIKNETTVTPLLTEDGDEITTEDDLPILATSTELLVTTGDSPDDAIFKNSNRVKVWMYNKYYPNGKLMFSGQINRVEFKYGSSDPTVKLSIYSDGLDLNNYIARGYPFNYTTEVTQATQNGSYASSVAGGDKGGGWLVYGQSFTTDSDQTNIGSISVMLQGTATVTLSLYDGPNGNLIGSVSLAVANGAAAETAFDFASLIEVNPSDEYFFALWLNPGQSINVYHYSPSPYAGGSAYESSYGGGSGGGSFLALTTDLYFIVKSGVPTTTTTYSTDDPVTDMAHGILLDYNARGGYITEGDFEATGLSLTYTFVVATVLDALKKILELCPAGYYSYIDLGTAQIDIKEMSTTPDFTIVRGRHITELNLALTIEQVKNYLLLSGGDTGGGVNLYREYTDSESASAYGIRTATKSDNRITLAATADAMGESFTEENAGEVQETSLMVKDEHVDITQFIPGKTIGFKNFGNFIDDMVLTIVRREPNFSDGIANLTLGRLPVRMNDEIQRISRELLNEQTINNPSSPS
jgi:hypothetical protein